MKKEILFPYGKEKLSYTFGEELVGVLTSSIEEYTPEADEIELVKRAIENPIASEKLSELAKGKENATITAIPDGVSVVVAK